MGWLFMALLLAIEVVVMSKALANAYFVSRVAVAALISNVVSGIAGAYTSIAINGGRMLTVWLPWVSSREVNTENEERIISSRPAKAFPELLNLISYLGKHGSIPDTGYAARAAAPATSTEAQPVEIDYDRLAESVGDKFQEAVRDIQIYTALEDVRKAENEYAKIENSAKM